LAPELAGDELLVGRATHSPDDIEADRAAGRLGVGPGHVTPAHPERPSGGLELVRWAAAPAAQPWFAIGGLNRDTVRPVLEAGATRIAVARAIGEAEDPERAARELRTLLESHA